MARQKETKQALIARAGEIFERLKTAYPDARCALDFESPFQLLVATILAAQCTDVRVNLTTPGLFTKYPTPRAFLHASPADIETIIHPCGFYHNKAKCIIEACRRIEEVFGGQVPGTMEELLSLAGVGRKTANVLLGECFSTPGIIVDTHCMRLSKRLGFSRAEDPVKIERDLMKIWPQPNWTLFSHVIVFHGRAVCSARAPQCSQCVIRAHCPFPETADGKRIAR